jgi:Zn-dependent protease
MVEGEHMSGDVIINGLIFFAVLLLSLSFHEFGHAWTALQCGDPTAQRLGRVSLNPVVHADPIGSVLLPLIMIFTGAGLIGWAKPVPFDKRNLRHPGRDDILISAAGPIANLVLALAASVAIRLTHDIGTGNAFGAFLATVLPFTVQINVLLAVFNLIPIVPLDGSWILVHLLPRDLGRRYQAFGQQWGFAVLLLLLFTGVAWTWIRTASGIVLPVLSAVAGTPLSR